MVEYMTKTDDQCNPKAAPPLISETIQAAGAGDLVLTIFAIYTTYSGKL
jgi:hypothetical protein